MAKKFPYRCDAWDGMGHQCDKKAYWRLEKPSAVSFSGLDEEYLRCKDHIRYEEQYCHKIPEAWGMTAEEVGEEMDEKAKLEELKPHIKKVLSGLVSPEFISKMFEGTP